jgi:hypothetical protein
MTSILAVNWEAIGAIGQIVGALAVVISLIYVAREIRSNARAARLASLGTANELLRQLAVHPELRELYYRGSHDFESLEKADREGFHALILQLFNIYQEMYYQHLESHLDPRQWDTIDAVMCDVINTHPGIQTWWRSRRPRWFNEEFVKHINQLQQAGSKDAS